METTDSDQQRGGMQRRGWRRGKKRGDGNGRQQKWERMGGEEEERGLK